MSAAPEPFLKQKQQHTKNKKTRGWKPKQNWNVCSESISTICLMMLLLQSCFKVSKSVCGFVYVCGFMCVHCQYNHYNHFVCLRLHSLILFVVVLLFFFFTPPFFESPPWLLFFWSCWHSSCLQWTFSTSFAWRRLLFLRWSFLTSLDGYHYYYYYYYCCCCC